MNILLLSNGAPNYHHFFKHLTDCFRKDGCALYVAVDSEFSKDINSIKDLECDIYEFSSYFAQHRTNPEILKTYSSFNLNSALLSDFERAQIYKIWSEREHGYFDRLKSALLSYFEEIFLQRKIEIILYENVSNAFAHFAFIVGKKLGVTYCGVGGARLPGRFSVTSDPLLDDRPQKIFSKIRRNEIKIPDEIFSWCDQYISNIEKIVPDYMRINGLDNIGLIKKYARVDKLRKVAKLFKHLRDDSYHSFQIGNPLRTHFNLFYRNVKRRLKISLMREYYDKPHSDESFFLYPLHFHPESSTSILAGTYLNELEVIRNIAFNLPEGTKLYVKDHVSAYGYPTLEFYKQLKTLPNVRVLSPHAATKELIKRSLAVITLTSTVGYEALLLGKKVFLFGSVFYQFHDDVIQIKDPSKLFDLFCKHLENSLPVEKEYNLQFVAAYYMSTEPGSLNMMLPDAQAFGVANMVYPALRERLKLTAQDSLSS